MEFGDILGQLMRNGMSPATQSRIQNALGESGLGGLGGILGNAMGGAQGSSQSAGVGAGVGGGLGGLLGGLTEAIGKDSGVGGLSQGQVGGIGALAGAILGGGGASVRGAVGGSAMALLGTLALSALKNWQAQSAADEAPAVPEAALAQMTSPDTAELCVRGMMEAAKSDGEISPEEVRRIVGKLQEGGLTAEEQRFVTEQLTRPYDIRGLVSAIPNQEVGAQVYAAALMAIAVDTDAEREFLHNLASGAGLDAGVVARLHVLVGAPQAAA